MGDWFESDWKKVCKGQTARNFDCRSIAVWLSSSKMDSPLETGPSPPKKRELLRMESTVDTDPMKVVPLMGSEGETVTKSSYAGRTIAVFTSGGDAQGR